LIYLDICIARLGSVSNSIISPLLAIRFGAPVAVWAGTFSCYISLLSALILVLFLNIQDNADEETTPLLHEHEQQAFEFNEHPGMSLLPRSFWMVCSMCIVLYGTVVPFNTIASDFLISKYYPNDIAMAGFVMSIPDFLSSIVVPVFGFIVDNYGQRITWLFICSFLIALSHSFLALTTITPIPFFVMLGVAYAIYGTKILYRGSYLAFCSRGGWI
jgi:nitrate/nitrite transporter NarK